MVHALREAHRVLRPGGIVMDLRPAAKHRRIGLGRGRGWRLAGVMRESFDKDHAADRAVADVVRAGLFDRGASVELAVDREMDTLDDFLGWLKEFGGRRPLASHAWLIDKLNRRLAARNAPIVVRGILKLQVLQKAE